MDEKIYLFVLHKLGGIGPKTYRALINRFGDAESIFKASEEEICDVSRVTQKMAAEIKKIEEGGFEGVQEEIDFLEDKGVKILALSDADYPKRLSKISDPPMILYVRGEIEDVDEESVAIAGSRAATAEGRKVSFNIAKLLAQEGYTVVSGFAEGIDTAAHEGALSLPTGRTIAVFGSGINIVHPPTNFELCEWILEEDRGAVLSECFYNEKPSGRRLMARDRIVSGLGKGTIIIEAGKKSGSLDTGKKALLQNRHLFVVKWDEKDTRFAGNEMLLRKEDVVPIEQDLSNFSEIIEILKRPKKPKFEQKRLF